MDETGILDRLMGFGMTRQEAGIYLCLYKNGELTGYEAAKQSGISRSNVYGGLAELTEMGAAYLMEGNVNRYTAVPIEEFCDNKIRQLYREKEYLTRNMPVMADSCDGYITIDGADNIRNKIITMLEKAEQRIYISVPELFTEGIRKELEAAAERGIKLVLITDRDTGMSGISQYLTDHRENQIRLIIDSVYVLTGDIEGKETDTCLYSGQKNFVNVFKEALRNEIRLIELTRGEKQNEHKE